MLIYVGSDPTATGGLKRIDTLPATLEQPAGSNHPSEITVSSDGRFAYLVNRGNDTITTFAVDEEVPAAIDEVPTGGEFPRHFALAGPWMHVANERSHSVTVLRPDDGVRRPTGLAVETLAPTCVLPWRQRSEPRSA